jgi:hypothetical protein
VGQVERKKNQKGEKTFFFKKNKRTNASTDMTLSYGVYENEKQKTWYKKIFPRCHPFYTSL